MKKNGQQTRSGKSRVLAVVSCGASLGAAERNWTVTAEGSIPSSSTSMVAVSPIKTARLVSGKRGKNPVGHPNLTPRRQLVAGNVAVLGLKPKNRVVTPLSFWP